MNDISSRISTIENCVESCHAKIDCFGKDLESLATDVRGVLDWILQQFGSEVPGTSSLRDKITSHTHKRSSSISPPDEQPPSVTVPIQIEIVKEQSSVIEDENVTVPVTTTHSFHFEHIDLNEGDSSGDEDANVDNGNQSLADFDAGTNCQETGVQDPLGITTSASPSPVSRGRPCKQISQNTTKEPRQCDQCGKILKDAGSLRQHKATHKDLRPFVCTECGKAFRRKFHLKTHSLIHSGEKKHQCGYCGKLFLLPKDLVAHERIHTGERPYTCHLCPKSFNLKSHLKMHVRTHTGEKPYKCDICEKAFSQSNSLRVHKKVHLKNQNMRSSTSGQVDSGNSNARGSSQVDVNTSGTGTVQSPPLPTVEVVNTGSTKSVVVVIPHQSGLPIQLSRMSENEQHPRTSSA